MKGSQAFTSRARNRGPADPAGRLLNARIPHAFGNWLESRATVPLMMMDPVEVFQVSILFCRE